MTKFLKFSFKNRIAFNYVLSGAFLIAIVFIFIYQTVKYTVNNHINQEIKEELYKHLNDVSLDENSTYLIQVDQWRAREHQTISVNPVFVQFYDNKNQLIDKSPNLKTSNLSLFSANEDNAYVNSKINNIPIRQIQSPIINNNKKVGYIVVAMSLEDFEIVKILKQIILITYPLVLILLFLFARFFAGKSIKPVSNIINTSNKLTKDNFSERVPLPAYKDELYTLSDNINNLLDRIESAIEREKQFTSDASHELRTPLAVVKGTLEVLIRKPREKQEYENKILFCINEINRLNYLLDQLLLLARFENHKQNIKNENVFLNAILLDTLTRFSDEIENKKILLKTKFDEDFYVKSDHYLLSIIFSNLISNAVKYNVNTGKITITLQRKHSKIVCCIEDTGIGISKENLEKIFNKFYRANENSNLNIKGTGLGLSIVKRLSKLLNIHISINSIPNKETSIYLEFN